MYGLFTFMSLTALTPVPGGALRCYHGLSAGTKSDACDEGVTYCMIGFFKESLFFSKMRLCGSGEKLWDGCREDEDGKVVRCYCSTDGLVLVSILDTYNIKTFFYLNLYRCNKSKETAEMSAAAANLDSGTTKRDRSFLLVLVELYALRMSLSIL